jgi:hypothetical protein
LLPSLSLSSRFSVLKREAARHHHLLVLSRRNPPFLFVNTNAAVASTVGRALLVFSKKKKMPTPPRPTPAKTVACFFTLIVFMARVMWGCCDNFYGVVAMP